MMSLKRPVPLASRPRVSVVIPCYNYGHYLAGAVRSAIDHQPDVDVDVCIVDDASPDGSGDVAREIATREPRVTVLQHPENRGHLQTYNDGLAAVDGTYVVLLSADDVLAPGALGRAASLMEAHPRVGLVYGFAHSFTTAEPPAPPARRVGSWTVWQGDDWLDRICRNGGTTIINPEAVMRRDVLQQAGGYHKDLPQTADMYLWLRAAQICDVGRVNGPVQAFYRVHGNNMHLTEFAGVVTDLRARAATIDELFGTNDDERSRHLRAITHRAIAYEAIDLASAAYDQGRLDVVPVDEFGALAQRLWPRAVRSPRWRLLRARANGSCPVGWMRSADRARDLRQRLLWQRWARYGF